MTDSPSMIKRQTVDEFEAVLLLPENQDRLFDLIDGEIIEKMPTELHNLIRQILLIAIWNFVVPRRLGRVTSETRTRASQDDRYNDRLPDIGFTTKGCLLPIVERGAVPQIPDLCIEVQSPDDYPKLMRAKANYYLQNGARHVRLVFTKKQLVEVLFPDGNYEHYYFNKMRMTGRTRGLSPLSGQHMNLVDVLRQGRYADTWGFDTRIHNDR